MAKKTIKSSDMVDISSHSSGKKKKQSSGGAKRTKKILLTCGKVLASFILILAITGSIVITALTVYVMKFVEPDESIDIKNPDLGYTTTLIATAADGTETEIANLHSKTIREWVDLDQIPKHVRQAFVAVEDKRFYDHDGVDWKRTFAAFANLFLNFYSTKQGGSTITQQLIKNITGDDDVNITRKFTEIFRAVNLEKVYSKDQILESYLNLIPLDQSIHGIQAASKYYFGKSVSDLDVVEGAALAAMVKSPRGYNPILHPEANKERRNTHVLGSMLEEGYITEAEYETYKATELKTAIDPKLPDTPDSNKYNSWFVDATIEEVIQDLVERNGWEKEYATKQVLSGGLKIYTTQDPAIQTVLEAKYKDTELFGDTKTAAENRAQSSMVIMDYNGQIKALVGGRGEKEGDRLFNRATMARRRPGSSIKPIAVYSPAIESNTINYSSQMEDSPFPTVIDGVQRNNWPQNYDKTYRGNILMPDAVRRSFNTIPVKLANQMNPLTCYNFLTQKLGFTTLQGTPDERGGTDIALSPMALGSLYHGMYLDELTAAYQIFGNQGVYTQQHTYTKVVNGAGDVILEKDPRISRALTPESATIMNRLLQNVVEVPGSTGVAAKLGNMPVVGKTGTATNDDGQTTDLAFVGCTPYYVAGIWVGNDDSSKLSGFTGSFSPPTIWKKVMTDVLKGYSTKSFEYSAEVLEMAYCSETGLLANEGCPEKKTGYYKSGYLPDYCTAH